MNQFIGIENFQCKNDKHSNKRQGRLLNFEEGGFIGGRAIIRGFTLECGFQIETSRSKLS